MERRTLVVKLQNEVKDPVGLPVDAEYLISTTESLAGSLGQKQSSSYSDIHIIEIVPDETAQAELFRLLKPSAKLMVDGIIDRDVGQAISVDLKIQGFMDIMAAKDPETGRRFVVAQKPSWESGASAPVSIPETKSWKVSVSELAEDDFVDEDALLAAAPVPQPDTTDCGTDATGNKRACANCTCGLADKEASDAQESNNSLSIEEKVVKASSCGNCYKGDAFRCASCPFLGKPAFEPGMEKVVLAMGTDDF
jgi:anamorsin